jgi:CubicO group peptidase (beta-lactamase class C family)
MSVVTQARHRGEGVAVSGARERNAGGSGPLLLGLLALVCASCSRGGPGEADPLAAALDAKLPAVIADGNAPSVQVAVVRGDRIVWSRAFGENAGVDRVYMNASVQKTFTAVAVLQLVEAGLVDLDADVGEYVPFPVRHPEFPETPITVRMLLAHRSGLDVFPHQFAWDTGSAFWPRYRPACPESLSGLTLEEFLRESLTPGGANYVPQAWLHEPGRRQHYSVSAYPLLRYLVGRVSGSGYEAYVRENIFAPLGMTSSGFGADEFAGRHAIPHTRIDGANVELPLWSGRGSLMHTTAADMAKLVLALMHDGSSGDSRILQPGTVELMRRPTTRYKVLFRGSDDLQPSARGLGHLVLRGGWLGIGGSTPGYQCLLRFHPGRQVGFVLLTNVNAILGGGHNYASARGEIYSVQEALVSVLDPTYVVRRRAGEIALVGALVAYVVVAGFWMRRRRMRRRAASRH